jgi:hypothetical protein
LLSTSIWRILKVKEFIANKNMNSGFKGNLVKAYNYYALADNMSGSAGATNGS